MEGPTSTSLAAQSTSTRAPALTGLPAASVICGKDRAGNAAIWATLRAKKPQRRSVVFIRLSKEEPHTGTPALAPTTCTTQCWEHTDAPDMNGDATATR